MRGHWQIEADLFISSVTYAEVGVGQVGSRHLRVTTALFFLLALVFSIASVLTASPGFAASPTESAGTARVPLLIKFRASASAADIAGAIQSSGGVVTRDLAQIRTKVIYVPSDARDRILAAYAHLHSVERAARAPGLQMTLITHSNGRCRRSRGIRRMAPWLS
jgi:hypothetical protein